MRRAWVVINFPPMTMATARILAGAGIFGLTLLVLVALILKPELAESDLFKSLAQAIVVQALIGLVMAFLYTGKNGGDDGTPQNVIVKNPPKDPVQVEDRS